MAPAATHPGGQDPVLVFITEGPPPYLAEDGRSDIGLSAYKLRVGAAAPQLEATSFPACVVDLRAIPRLPGWEGPGMMLVSSDHSGLLVPPHVIRSSSQVLSDVLGIFKPHICSTIVKFFNDPSESATVLDAFFTFVTKGTFRFPHVDEGTIDERSSLLAHLCAFMERYRCPSVRYNFLNNFYVNFVLDGIGPGYLIEGFVLGAAARNAAFCALVLQKDEERAVQAAAAAARHVADAPLLASIAAYPHTHAAAVKFVRTFAAIDVAGLSREVHEIIPNEYLWGLVNMLQRDAGVRWADRFAALMAAK